MSNIYVQEPPTNGKVVLTTSLGEIEIELWSKECPKACRNFVQLCLEEFFNGTIFHRVVPNFIAQGGDPTGTGHGGESIYGEPFKNEVHSRLRFVRRGLVATANTGNNDNESQFFFTLGACPELQNKHTIFGRVGGNTLFNMIKFNDLDIDNEERPRHPPKILKTEVINNPFPDIEPRISQKQVKGPEETKPKVKKTKNLKLLSFGDEEEDETDAQPVKTFKGKSSHDLTDDPRLSIIPAVNMETGIGKKSEQKQIESEVEKVVVPQNEPQDFAANADDEVVDEKKQEAQNRLKKIKEQIKDLKREMKNPREDTEEELTKKQKLDGDHVKDEEENEILKNFHEQHKKYAVVKTTRRGKGADREAETLAYLKKFQEKLSETRLKETNDSVADEESDDHTWLNHTLKFEDNNPTLARDANTKGDDWFEISDPRNPLTKRRREESKKILKQKGSTTKMV
ncbi:spliceosome-associated protein CWC27 homolog [Daphnia carinata]|uniref:spliceosome-associated protein CWC27 homolog n=1 Tax=Daphnia carinata TaxID=120202 RepID=UPI00257D5952|nr:spliceosome-associated protein CWC27 homolog [Daphnia carinata]